LLIAVATFVDCAMDISLEESEIDFEDWFDFEEEEEVI
jgi:hypothetical protein